jgi:hypothetical protein
MKRLRAKLSEVTQQLARQPEPSEPARLERLDIDPMVTEADSPPIVQPSKASDAGGIMAEGTKTGTEAA